MTAPEQALDKPPGLLRAETVVMDQDARKAMRVETLIGEHGSRATRHKPPDYTVDRKMAGDLLSRWSWRSARQDGYMSGDKHLIRPPG